MIDIQIADGAGEPLPTRVQIGNARILVHRGRGGERSHGQLRRTLDTIFDRFSEQYLTPETFLMFAGRVGNRRVPEDPRLVGPEEFFLDGPAYAQEVLARITALGDDRWEALRLHAPPMPDYALRALVDGTVKARERQAMPMAELRRVQRRHVEAAILELQSGAPRFNRFENATGWLLLPKDGGEPLPPKRVFGVALSLALRTYTGPNDFASGRGIFEILRGFGFQVLPLDEVRAARRRAAKKSKAMAAALPPSDEERAWIEGHPRMVVHLERERSGSMPARFKALFRDRHERLFCERCERDFVDDYGEEIAEACFEVHHTVPVSKMQPGHETRFEQLQLLCSNCHRATHRQIARDRL